MSKSIPKHASPRSPRRIAPRIAAASAALAIVGGAVGGVMPAQAAYDDTEPWTESSGVDWWDWDGAPVIAGTMSALLPLGPAEEADGFAADGAPVSTSIRCTDPGSSIFQPRTKLSAQNTRSLRGDASTRAVKLSKTFHVGPDVAEASRTHFEFNLLTDPATKGCAALLKLAGPVAVSSPYEIGAAPDDEFNFAGWSSDGSESSAHGSTDGTVVFEGAGNFQPYTYEHHLWALTDDGYMIQIILDFHVVQDPEGPVTEDLTRTVAEGESVTVTADELRAEATWGAGDVTQLMAHIAAVDPAVAEGTDDEGQPTLTFVGSSETPQTSSTYTLRGMNGFSTGEARVLFLTKLADTEPAPDPEPKPEPKPKPDSPNEPDTTPPVDTAPTPVTPVTPPTRDTAKPVVSG